jgi:hypothetical protein
VSENGVYPVGYTKPWTEITMTYPPPSGPGDQYQPPVQPYQPPPDYQYQYQQPSPANPYATPAYQYGYPNPYQYQQAPPTDGMAIAALVVSCVAGLGLCAYGVGGLLGIPGAILGHVARRRIRATGAGGDGLALAGIIVGWIAAGIGLLAVVGIILLIVFSDDL